MIFADSFIALTICAFFKAHFFEEPKLHRPANSIFDSDQKTVLSANRAYSIMQENNGKKILFWILIKNVTFV